MRLRTPLIVTGLYGVLSVLMFGLFVPAVVAACGAPPLDSTPGWTRADAQEMAGDCGATGLHAYEQLATLDVFYPLALALFVGSWIIWLGQRLILTRWTLALLLVPTVVNAAFDYLENAAVWEVIRSSGNDPGALLDVGGTFTTIKTVSGALSFVIVAVLGILTLFVTLRKASKLKSHSRNLA